MTPTYQQPEPSPCAHRYCTRDALWGRPLCLPCEIRHRLSSRENERCKNCLEPAVLKPRRAVRP